MRAQLKRRFLTLLTGRNLPKIQQPCEPQPSIINEKTIADFARVVEQIRMKAAPSRLEEPRLKTKK